MTAAFVNLHTHSHYSILEAPFAPKAILEKAKEMGHGKVAITDRGNGHGLVEIVMQAKKVGDIEPILGVELAVSLDGRFEKRAGMDGKEGYIVLLAQNQKGYENLLALISKAHLEGFYYQPRVDLELLREHSEGLYVLTGARLGLVGKAYFDYGSEKGEETLGILQEIFGKENVYLELVARHFEEQKELNIWKAELSKEKGIGIVATSDARCKDASVEAAADVFWCIGKNQNVHDPTRFKGMEQNWFKSWEEISRELSYVGTDVLETARENTVKIGEGCNVSIEFDQSLLPKFEVPEGHTEATWLKEECETRIKGRYADEFYASEHLVDGMDKEEDYLWITPGVVKDRLDYELSIIGKMGFDAYFLIVADFIDYAKEVGIFVGPGRGSAAGSLVAYLLGITNIDPLRYELLFERFLNPERISMPDIDIDFSDERREEVMDYVVEKYGSEQVSKVCTFGTLAAKAALKDVGRALGVEYGRMNAMTKLLPNKPGFGLEDAKEIKEFMDLVNNSPDLKRVFDTAETLEGSVRHVSVHACAVIIGGQPLYHHTPVQWAPGTDDVKITQFPYQQLESIGLLKMDFLGLKNLSILEKTLIHIKNTTGQELNLDELPINDKKVFEMMSNGETTGVFQFESAGMRRYLRELQPTELEDLVAMNALYRPGPMEYIPQYIAGKHNPKKVKYPHPVLEPLLRKTYGIAVYQEQILRIAQEFSGFSLGEADILRKAIGKKIISILEEQRKKFIDGGIAKGHTKQEGEKLFDDIVVPFAGYGFNRSHAVCYARIAYETAYMRANYPVEFMAAMMTTDRNNTDRIVLEMNECQTMGIEVFPPSVNESGSHFTVVGSEKERMGESEKGADEDEKSSFYETNGKSIRFGLTAIKGLGEETAEVLIAEREGNGVFKSLEDLAKRLPAKLMNKKTLEALSFSGALDEFGDRGSIVASLEDLAKFAREQEDQKEAGQIGLFGGMDDGADDISFELKKVETTQEDILNWERESLGLFVSDHPLRGLAEYFEKYGKLIGNIPEEEDEIKRLEEEEKEKLKEGGKKGGKKKKEKRMVTVHGLVSSVKKITTKAGAQMAVIEIEDTSGKMECAVFPKIYEGINKAAFEVDAFIQLIARPDERDGVYNLLAEKIKVGNLKEVKLSWAEEQQSNGATEQRSNGITDQRNNGTTEEQNNGITDTESSLSMDSSSLSKEASREEDLFEVRIPETATENDIGVLRSYLLSLDKGGSKLAIWKGSVKKMMPYGLNLTPEVKEKLNTFFEKGDRLEF